MEGGGHQESNTLDQKSGVERSTPNYSKLYITISHWNKCLDTRGKNSTLIHSVLCLTINPQSLLKRGENFKSIL